jgi:hypothetical protein
MNSRREISIEETLPSNDSKRKYFEGWLKQQVGVQPPRPAIPYRSGPTDGCTILFCWERPADWQAYCFFEIFRAFSISPLKSIVPQSKHMVEKMGTYPVRAVKKRGSSK